jgi:hypothetical protein
MDRRERQRLKDEIDKGTLDVGIHKIDEAAAERERRSPVLQGAWWGIAAGASVANSYLLVHPSASFNAGPLALVLFGCLGAGAALGALAMWLLDRFKPKPRKPLK